MFLHCSPQPSRRPLAAALGLLVLMAAGCSESTGPDGRGSTVALSEMDTLFVDEVRAVAAEVRSRDGETLTDARIQWRSLNPEVAGVDTNGVVTGRSIGATTIVAALPNRSSDSMNVVVIGFTHVDVAAYHSCGRTSTGAVYCWGLGTSGQLGDGRSESDSLPVRVAMTSPSTAISAGGAYSCALSEDGLAFCWGRRDWSVFTTPVATLLPDSASGDLRYRDIDAGGQGYGVGYTCGHDIGGSLYCIGYNDYGRLGLGRAFGAATVTTIVTGNHRFRAFDIGLYRGCGLADAGDLYCWGIERSGERVWSGTPALVYSDTALRDVAVGDHWTCLLDSRGGARCWRYGQGGAEPAVVPGALRFASLSTEGSTVCGVTLNGAGYCWGENEAGQGGDGTTAVRSLPTRIAGNLNFAQIDVGPSHSCGVTLQGAAYCWGRNSSGQIGDGTTIDRLTPSRVSGPPL